MFVHTENKPTIPAALDFTQIWTPIARSMGAIMVDTLSDSIGRKIKQKFFENLW